MNGHQWAGTITVETITQQGGIVSWAKSWLDMAIKAEQAGKELIVFEVPKNGLLYSADIDPIGDPGADLLLFDTEFYRALTGVE